MFVLTYVLVEITLIMKPANVWYKTIVPFEHLVIRSVIISILFYAQFLLQTVKVSHVYRGFLAKCMSPIERIRVTTPTTSRRCKATRHARKLKKTETTKFDFNL